MLRRTASRSVAESWPATMAVPAVAFASVHKILMVVDLPALFGPRKPKVSPLATVKSMPRTASTSPYRLTRPETVITVSGPALSPSNCLASGPVPVCTVPVCAVPACAAILAASLDLAVPDRPSTSVIAPSLAASGAALLCIGRGLVLVSGEDPVQRLAGVGQQLACLGRLGVGASADDLEGRHRDLADQAAHLHRRAAGATGDYVPGGVQLVRVRGRIRAALVGQLVGAPAALASLSPDQALILELLQRRVDRAGAWPPDSPAALADLLDDLVAGHGLLAEQCQRCGPHVTAPGSRTAHAALAAPGAESVHLGSAGKARTGRETGTAGTAGEPRTSERAREVPAATATRSAAMPFLAVAMPAASFAVVGRLPSSCCAAPAALFVVRHVVVLLVTAWRSGSALSPSSDCHRSSSIGQRYIVNFSLASAGFQVRETLTLRRGQMPHSDRDRGWKCQGRAARRRVV